MDYPRAENNEFVNFVRKLTASSLYLDAIVRQRRA
jgi:hypothetical protein